MRFENPNKESKDPMTPRSTMGEALDSAPRWLNRVFGLVASIVAIFIASWVVGNLWENVDANEIAVFQQPISGKLSVYETPGMKWQGFAKVTKYHKRVQYWFPKIVGTDTTGNPLRVRFNDGGHATMYGSFAWEMPLADSLVIPLHMKYGSEEAIAQQLIHPAAERSIYMTGPLMTSTESYAVRRPDLLSFIEDQLSRGVYRTRKIDTKARDLITGEEKSVSIVEIVNDANGVPLRQEVSPVGEFGIRTFNLSFNNIIYDKVVEDQIRQQQLLAMSVQTKVAEAKQSEQQAITAEQNGKAAAATAKWKQEAIKAQQVTEAQQRFEVASLNAKTAAQYKLEQTLQGEGDAAKKRAFMTADGGLESKLKALVEINKNYADAIKGYGGNWVPNVVMGGNAGTSAAGSGALQMIELLSVKAAKDLATDMQLAGAAQTASKK